MYSNAQIAANSQTHSPTSVIDNSNKQFSNDDKQSDVLSLMPIQCKLTVGAVDDPLEHEADAMADRVMRMPQENFIQRKCAHCEQAEKEEELHRKPLSSFIQKKGSSTGTGVSDTVNNRINSSKGSGNSMDAGTKTFMESRFEADFRNVNIHTSNEATELNRELNARAFAIGNDIYFNEGQYNPSSEEGKHLLAHELTHTLQQTGTIQRDPPTSLSPGTYLDIDPDLSAPQVGVTRAQRGVGNFGLHGTLRNPLALSPFRLTSDPTQPGYNIALTYTDRCERALQSVSLEYDRGLIPGLGGQISQSDDWRLGGRLGLSVGDYSITPGLDLSFQRDNLVGGAVSFGISGRRRRPIPRECLSQPPQPGDGTNTQNDRPPGGNTGGGDGDLHLDCTNVSCDPLPSRNSWQYLLCCIGRGETNNDETNAELIPQIIYFPYDMSFHKTESENTLEYILDIMQRSSSIRVQITGHTSMEGRERYNQGLSQRRANHVSLWLQTHRIDSSRISVIALGESVPAVTEPPEPPPNSLRLPEDEAIRDLNRRAVVTLYDPSGQVRFVPRFPPFTLSTQGLSVTPPSRLRRGGLLGSPHLRW